jgi:DNA-3-methyladenine glycosylase
MGQGWAPAPHAPGPRLIPTGLAADLLERHATQDGRDSGRERAAPQAFVVVTGHGPPRLPFPRELLAGDTLEAARALLGARLVRDAEGPAAPRRVGRIVEIEAYMGPADRASHARMGTTARNRVMFGPAGIAYVYLVYGMHHCLNVVTGADSFPAALLVRAVEPLEGTDAMRLARETSGRAAVPDARLAAGPGLVGLAFDVDRALSGVDMCDPASPLRLESAPAGEPEVEVVTTPRVGIGFAGEPWVSVPWRFVVAGSPSLSRRPR